MRNFCLFMLMAVCSLMAQATDYPYLVFTNTNGTTTVMNVSALTMSVSGSSLQVTNADETKTFTLTELASMQFSADGSTTALENVIDADADVEVFAVSGVQLGSFRSIKDAAQNLSTGAYLIKQGNNTQTIVVK